MSTENKRFTGDLLFGFQLVMAWIFTVPQVVRSFQSTAGMTITWTMFCSLFVLINLFLAIGAYQQSKSRKALQVVIVYGNWLVLWLTLFATISVKGSWYFQDTVLTAIIVLCTMVLLAVRWRQTVVATVSEPITRGIVALFLKSVPQLFIAYCIIRAGKSDGLSGVSLIIGHITVCTRLAEIILAARQDGWNKKNVGMLVSESGNEISWLCTTVAWLVYR
jgi:uncharacterized protein with PQ loop repeat